MSIGRILLFALAILLNFKRIDGQITPISQGMLGKSIPGFSLKTVNKGLFQTTNLKEVKGIMVVFTCNHCPFAKLYTQRLNQLHQKYAPLGVPLLAVNSMDTIVYEEEIFSAMQKRATSEGFVFPYAQDADQSFGRTLQAEHTPQVFLLWKNNEQWIVKYMGSVDDNGEEPEKADPFLANAVDQMLQNQSITVPLTESFGCRIHYRKPSKP